jgi:hypothetical protein
MDVASTLSSRIVSRYVFIMFELMSGKRGSHVDVEVVCAALSVHSGE